MKTLLSFFLPLLLLNDTFCPVVQKEDLQNDQVSILKDLLINSDSLQVESQKYAIQPFLILIKNRNKAGIAKLVRYPFYRDYPILKIQNEEEFVLRFDEVFDDSILAVIEKSDALNDWSLVGWRGYMLHNGDVWIDEEGRLLGVNYQTRLSQEIRDSLIVKDKNQIYEQLRNYKSPVCLLKTESMWVRVDQLSDNSYRLVSWELAQKLSEKPKEILLQGKMERGGSCGNVEYIFKNKGLKYLVEIIECGSEEDPPARLSIYKGKKLMLEMDAVLVD